MDKVNIDALIYKFSKSSPVPEASGSSINLVDQEASCLTRIQSSKQLVEDRPAP